MTAIPLGKADYRRGVAKSPDLILKNRYFESNPILSPDQVSLITRPGLRHVKSIGNGPIRQVYSAPGAFANDLFVISDLQLYRYSSATDTATLIGTTGTNTDSAVSMAATGTIGDDIPNYLFLTDGGVLWCYTEDGFASGTLTSTGAISNNETVTIDTIVYKWTSGSVDAGTPDGSVANPWLVALGGTAAISLENLYHAIRADGTLGTTYSTTLEEHPTVTAENFTSTTLAVRAKTAGVLGNSIATTETGANISWGGAVLSGGGSPSLVEIIVPGDVGAISLAHIDGYIVVVPTQNEGVNGRFYWIEPGETTIDPLNFATAERSPDAILQVRVFSDQIMFMSENTTENWIVTGDPDAPFQRFQGVLFDRGIWEGTACQIKESIVLIDAEGSVLQIGGGVKVISNPSIEQRIRRAIQYYRFATS